jgi:hypothetical protein
VPFGETPDSRVPLGVDPDGDELAEAPVLADDAERAVVRSDERARGLDDPAQDDR